ncbi:pyridoxamine kinase [Clostridiaceae bacterium HSG29]|nr:pyridoxamine kinase [Clostridiaceae bacterium HSG29]
MKKINPVKKVAAIHDLSGFGRASLTAIIPVLSTMGVQVCPVPTAVLSTHTGGFENFTLVDLTDSMSNYINHWKEIELSFDCIYSGFLASVRQIEIVSNAIDIFSNEDNFVVVDPVMGDDGVLYQTMDDEMVDSMRELIKKADIITPNFTEACYLLNEEYTFDISEEEIKLWLKKLSKMGPEIVVLTSVPNMEKSKKTSVIAYNRENDVFWKVSCTYIPASYPGTGDAFTSVLIGSILQGDSLPISLEKGVQFITNGIKASYGFDYPKREGILLERVLDTLKLPVITGSYEMMK